MNESDDAKNQAMELWETLQLILSGENVKAGVHKRRTINELFTECSHAADGFHDMIMVAEDDRSFAGL